MSDIQNIEHLENLENPLVKLVVGIDANELYIKSIEHLENLENLENSLVKHVVGIDANNLYIETFNELNIKSIDKARKTRKFNLESLNNEKEEKIKQLVDSIIQKDMEKLEIKKKQLYNKLRKIF